MEVLILILCIAVLVGCGVLRTFAGRDWKLGRGDSWGKSYQDEWGLEAGQRMNRTGKYERLNHEFGPVFDERSRILILGSFPSVKSRKQQFYYGHAQNRFWKVLAAVTGEATPESIEEKKAFLLRNRIAVWDVIAQCDIIGSSDSSIRSVVPVDLPWLLERTDIVRIYANGGKAYELYQKYLLPVTGRDCVRLPSTSPANASCSLDRLTEVWREQLRIGDIG